MSDTPDIDKYEKADWWTVFRATQLCRELKQERDEAREELARVRKELVAANRGAETNAKVNQRLCTRLAEAKRERDDARREINEVKRAAIEVLKFIPVAHCSEMYHGKCDMHFLGPCPVVERHNARIDKLRAILKEEAK